MPQKLAISVLLAAGLVIAGCASDKGSSGSNPAQATIIGSTDWSQSEMVTVDLADYSFTPSKLTFQHGKPYQLHLVNKSSHSHTFSSDTFFKAIAVQKLLRNGTASSTADLDEDIDFAPGEVVDLYFVADKPGSYDLYCGKFMHEMLGMDGQITVM
ncbi:MAG: cupredoxin domain-containing protein [Dongiaceae bacterium]